MRQICISEYVIFNIQAEITLGNTIPNTASNKLDFSFMVLYTSNKRKK